MLYGNTLQYNILSTQYPFAGCLCDSHDARLAWRDWVRRVGALHYREKDREREREMYIFICIHIYIYIYVYI